MRPLKIIRRNRKKYLKRVILREAAITLKSIGILLSICFFAFLYVYQSITILRTGYRIKQKEEKLEELDEKILNLQVVISKIESPSFVKKRIIESGLNLKPCNEESIIRVSNEKTKI